MKKLYKIDTKIQFEALDAEENHVVTISVVSEYVRRERYDVLAKAFERLFQEIQLSGKSIKKIKGSKSEPFIKEIELYGDEKPERLEKYSREGWSETKPTLP